MELGKIYKVISTARIRKAAEIIAREPDGEEATGAVLVSDVSKKF